MHHRLLCDLWPDVEQWINIRRMHLDDDSSSRDKVATSRHPFLPREQRGVRSVLWSFKSQPEEDEMSSNVTRRICALIENTRKRVKTIFQTHQFKIKIKNSIV